MSDMILEMLDILRKGPPEMTIGAFVAGLERLVDHAECRWCHKPISMYRRSEDSFWVHDDPTRMRGCRAASFDGKGWNDALPKDRKATPEPE